MSESDFELVRRSGNLFHDLGDLDADRKQDDPCRPDHRGVQ